MNPQIPFLALRVFQPLRNLVGYPHLSIEIEWSSHYDLLWDDLGETRRKWFARILRKGRVLRSAEISFLDSKKTNDCTPKVDGGLSVVSSRLVQKMHYS